MIARQLRSVTLVTLGAVVLGAAACRGAAPADEVCTCTPGNRSQTRQADGSVLDGPALLGKLRRHRRDVEQHRTPRDIKVLDDELRFEIANFCQPCGAWVHDRMTIEDLFPLARLDDAANAVCMGLVLRDGSTAWGDARPRPCR
jgi:hypothetical protein